MAWRLVRGAAVRLLRRLDFTWITPDLAVGAQFSPAQAPDLARAGIASVLDLRAEGRPEAALLEHSGLRLLHLPVRDGAAPTEEQLWKAVAWVEAEIAQGRRVLVHCRAGMGRSVLVACAVLMAQGMVPADAFRLVKQRRPIAGLSEEQWRAARRFWHSQGGLAADTENR
ncbi:MAG: dual specificity protein phosphatase family protein [Chloroflexi bacterium]|nr:dual specificity protein phosphatase family protein [Chloroflexota bacterium]